MSKLKVNCRSAVTAPALRSVSVRPPPRKAVAAVRSLELDWSDPDTILGALGAVAGLSIGILAPIFYTQRVEDDEASLDELRTLNRKTFKETGEYLTQARLRSWPTAHSLPISAGFIGSCSLAEGLPCQHRPLEGTVCATSQRAPMTARASGRRKCVTSQFLERTLFPALSFCAAGLVFGVHLDLGSSHGWD